MKLSLFILLVFSVCFADVSKDTIYDTITVKQTVIDTVHRLDYDSLTVALLKDSQAFYNNAFDSILFKVSIGLCVIGILIAIVGIFLGIVKSNKEREFEKTNAKILKLEKDLKERATSQNNDFLSIKNELEKLKNEFKKEIEKLNPLLSTFLNLFIDPRDGKLYRTVKIGNQMWLAENLAFECEGSKVYDNDPTNLKKYGYLYDWETAKKAVPPGWHLPNNKEWLELFRLADGTSGKEMLYSSKVAWNKLKAKSGWNNDCNGTDEFGFSALPGGYGSGPSRGICISDDGFHDVGNYGNWWSTNEFERIREYFYGGRIGCDDEGLLWINVDKSTLFSVRCVKD